MTRIQLISDVHIEFHRDGGQAFLGSHEPAGDILVLAGDMGVLSKRHREGYLQFLSTIHNQHQATVMVLGNHEYYHGNAHGHAGLKKMVEDLGITVLDNSPATVSGVRFYGGTGWYQNRPGNEDFGFSDFEHILKFTPWVYGSHQKFLRGLNRYGADTDVVVTHHAPSPLSVNEKHRTSDLNRFFHFDVGEEALPPLWLHGHMHDATDYQLGTTRVVCNPYGYPWENARNGYQPALAVEV